MVNYCAVNKLLRCSGKPSPNNVGGKCRLFENHCVWVVIFHHVSSDTRLTERFDESFFVELVEQIRPKSTPLDTASLKAVCVRNIHETIRKVARRRAKPTKAHTPPRSGDVSTPMTCAYAWVDDYGFSRLKPTRALFITFPFDVGKR